MTTHTLQSQLTGSPPQGSSSYMRLLASIPHALLESCPSSSLVSQSPGLGASDCLHFHSYCPAPGCDHDPDLTNQQVPGPWAAVNAKWLNLCLLTGGVKLVVYLPGAGGAIFPQEGFLRTLPEPQSPLVPEVTNKYLVCLLKLV